MQQYKMNIVHIFKNNREKTIKIQNKWYTKRNT